MRVLAGFYRWLEGGGREMPFWIAKNLEKRKRWERMALDYAALPSPLGEICPVKPINALQDAL